jgi:hypothetical protein
MNPIEEYENRGLNKRKELSRILISLDNPKNLLRII